MKLRREGRVAGAHYEVVDADGTVLISTPLADARNDTRLAAAIKRNGWQKIPEA